MSFKSAFSAKSVISVLVAAITLSVATPLSAQAYGGWHRGPWNHGHWYHGWHGGASGWWWITAGNWYFYTRPVYPYPVYVAPPVVVQPQVVQQGPPPPPMIAPGPAAQPPAPAPQVAMPMPTIPPGYTGGYYYFCDQARAYYPYVATCPGGWTPVPVHPTN